MSNTKILVPSILLSLTGCLTPMGGPTTDTDKAGSTVEGYLPDGKRAISIDCDRGPCQFLIHVAATENLQDEVPFGISVTVPNADYEEGESIELETRDGMVEATQFQTKLLPDTPFAAVGVNVRESAKVVLSGDVRVDVTTRSDRGAGLACHGLCETPKFPGAFKVRSTFDIWSLLSGSDAQYDPMLQASPTYEDEELIGEMPKTLPEVFREIDDEPFRFLTRTALLRLSDGQGDDVAVARVAARALLQADDSEAADVWEEAMMPLVCAGSYCVPVEGFRISELLGDVLKKSTFISTIDPARGIRRLEGIEFTNVNHYFADTRRYLFGGDVHETNLEVPVTYERSEDGDIAFRSELDSSVIGSLMEVVLGEVLAQDALASDQPGVGVDALMNVLFTSCDRVQIRSSLLDQAAARMICEAGQAGLRDHLNGILDRAVYQAASQMGESATIRGGALVTDLDDGGNRLGEAIPFRFEDGGAGLVLLSGSTVLGELTGDVSIEPAEPNESEPAL